MTRGQDGHRLGPDDQRAVGAADGRTGVLSSLQRSRGNQAVGRLLGVDPAAAWDALVTGSPPASGPGSRTDPLVAGDGAVLRVEQMRADAYYRSPVNPQNPVLVWTDGSTLHFGPSQSQVAAGRLEPRPEPTLSLPDGYTVVAIHWDRRSGRSAAGALFVVATKQGAEDLEVAVTSTLEQRSYVPSPELAGSAGSHVTRQNAEFLEVGKSSVPVGLSGAAAAGPIHQVSFPDGFFRYRAKGGSHDLYVGQETSATYLVERVTGDIVRQFDPGSITAVTVDPAGIAHIDRDTFFGIVPVTATIDLRERPPRVEQGLGHATDEPGYADAREQLRSMGVDIEERGARMTVAEMQAIIDTLTTDGNRGLDLLVQFRALEHGASADEPVLEVVKRVGRDVAAGFANLGSGTPLLSIAEPFEATVSRRRSTVRHELAHVLSGAADAVRMSRMSGMERANLEGAMRFAARRGRAKANRGLLRATEYGEGDRVPKPAGASSWRRMVGEHPELASIWVALLRRYTFIPDPEGTGEFRGVSLADESRYSGAGDVPSGHPADTVSEFISSFVACATVFPEQFREAVLAAEAAGNARGGRGGSYVRSLYRRSWNLIDRLYVPLGPNPF